MKIPRPNTFVLMVVIGVFAAVPAFEASARAVPDPLLLAQATPSVSAEEAAALVRAQSGGRILSMRLETRSQLPVYRVKVLLDGGRVRVYRVDASTGRIVQ